MLVGLAALLVAGSAAAQDRAAPIPGGSERFWVQERPLAPVVSTDLLTQDRRFAGALGYGINLMPPEGARGGAALDSGRGPGPLSIDNLHFGIDVMQPYGNRNGSVAQLAMNYGGLVANNLALSVGPTLSVGGDSTASLFSPTVAAGGGFLRRLQSDTGLRDYGLRGSAVYSLSDSWALTGVLGYRRTLGELGISSADEQFFSVLGLGYRF
ncbi:MAG: MipA/OmpV family protein [Pseudomonadota bacterium]